MARKYYQSLWVEFCKKVSNLFCIYLYDIYNFCMLVCCWLHACEMNEMHSKQSLSSRRQKIHIKNGMPTSERRGFFMLDFLSARLIGSALSAFHSFHKREPTANEHAEIVDIIEVYAEQIRDFFAKFNPQ